jgi:TM2 domain-containing membrane protein YozV
MFTIASDRAFESLGFVITLPATVFSSVGAGRYMVKCRLTNIAICGNLHAGVHSFAGSGTILKTGKSVFGDIDKVFTMPARHLFSSKGF